MYMCICICVQTKVLKNLSQSVSLSYSQSSFRIRQTLSVKVRFYARFALSYCEIYQISTRRKGGKLNALVADPERFFTELPGP